MSSETVAFSLSSNSGSFMYEDLIFTIKKIQNQILQANDILDNRWINQKTTQEEVKSRSFTFIDPYGNRTTNRYMDYQRITTVFNKYKQNYVPKYLHDWIKISKQNDTPIIPLTGTELVSHFTDGSVLETYGQIMIWAKYHESFSPQKLVLTVRLTDNIQNITEQINQKLQCTISEVKSLLAFHEERKLSAEDWNNGTSLKFEDTILFAQLYQENCIVLAQCKDAVNN